MLAYLLHRPIAILSSTLLVGILGWVALGQLPLSLLPPFAVPELQVSVTAPQQGAVEIEERLLLPLRNACGQLPGLVDLESFSQQGQGTVVLRYRWGTDMQRAFLQLQATIDETRRQWPPELERPLVRRLDASNLPLLSLAYRDAGLAAFEQQEFASEVLRRRLEQLPGVSRVALTGGSRRQVSVQPDLRRLREAGLTPADLRERLLAAGQPLASLRLAEGNYIYPLELIPPFRSPAELARLPLPLDAGRTIVLGQVATVSYTPARPVATFLGPEGEAILLQVFPRPDANLIETAQTLLQTVQELRQQFPTTQLEVVSDEAAWARFALGNLWQSLWLGGLGAMLMLWLLLRSWRAALLMGLAIPASLLLAATLAWACGLSLNLLSLSGLIIGLGVLIDNGIIVTENMLRLRAAGQPLLQAMVAGARQMAAPMLAATLTNLCVFVPLLLMGGLPGVFFQAQAAALALTLGASLLVALLLLPLLFRYLYPAASPVPVTAHSWLLRQYERAFHQAGRHPRGRRLVVGIWLLLALVAAWQLPGALLPDYPQAERLCRIHWEPGLSLQANTTRAQTLMQDLAPDLRIAYAEVGAVPAPYEALPRPQHLLLLRVVRPPGRSWAAVEATLQAGIDRQAPQARGSWEPLPNLFSLLLQPRQAPWEIYLLPTDGRSLVPAAPALALADSLRQWTGGDLSMTLPFVAQQEALVFHWDQGAMLTYGLRPEQLRNSLQALAGEWPAGELRQRDRNLPLLMAAPAASGKVENWLEQPVMGTDIPLKAVLRLERQALPVQVNGGFGGPRQAIRVASLTGDPPPVAALRRWARGWNLAFGGTYLQARQQNQTLALALALGLLLLWVVMAAQFESWWRPLVVLLTAATGLAGAVLALWLTGTSLNLMAGIGLIVVSGIVVNDAILKVDAIDRYRREGLGLEAALVEAGRDRFRPILLTSLTTLLALWPLLFAGGLGAALQRPLVWAVTGGLISATLAAWFLTPFWYRYFWQRFH